MNKAKAYAHIQQFIQKDDRLIGFFLAMQPSKFWLFFLIGPLATLSMRYYFLAVTQNGIYFHRLNLWGKFAEDDFFRFDEIENIDIGNGFLQKPMKFKFKNGRKLKIKAQLKGSDKVAKLDDETLKHILQNIPSA